VAPGWNEIRRALQGHVPTRGTDSSLKQAAVALIFREGPAGIEMLFIRRADHPDDPWSGQMAFPGGRSEPGDDDLKVTAIRETQEEIGLDLTAAESLGAMDEVRAAARIRPTNITITPFAFRLLVAAEPRLNSEVRSVHWLSLKALLNPDAQGTFEYRHEGETFVFPCLRLQDIMVWGLTYRMFMNLAALFAPPASDGPGT
jgi:8-oxo-dGTP pyrophosphatase MutT (NUDIX family)